MQLKYLTSESVCMGHPDKMCDRISDAILDAYLKLDSCARVAVECMVSSNAVFVAGQITAKETVEIEKIIRDTIAEIGYDTADKGMEDFEKQGGVSFLIIQYTGRDEMYYLTYDRLAEFYERSLVPKGRKSFTYEEIDKSYRVTRDGSALVHFLPLLQKDLDRRD